jgi:hypothetical protein
MEFNFENFKIKTTDTATQLSYTASNISAQNKRIIVRHLVPQSNDGIRTFHLENVDGSAKSWKIWAVVF